ncbi:MAG: hypothetical protein OK455_01690 [Thaumarchaeota archaeon]|nr:hypothetical protein [Nitrososphaerota archaeon]
MPAYPMVEGQGFGSTKGLILLAKGRKEDLLRILPDQTSPGLQLNRILCVSDDEALDSAIRQRMDEFGYRPEFLAYSDLRTINAMAARGKSILLISPSAAINESETKGMLDGGLVKLLLSRICRDILAFRETDLPLHLTPVRTLGHLSQWISKGIDTPPKSWFYELLLTLLYRRHESILGLQRLVASSVWGQVVHRNTTDFIRQARAEFLQEEFISERKRSLACNELGRLIVERNIPFDKIDVAKIRRELEPSSEGWKTEDDSPQRYAYLEELALERIERHGWVTVDEVAAAAVDRSVMPTRSTGKTRRFLKRLVAEETLVESVYRTGVGRPRLVYMKRNSTNAADIFDNTCGECVFYSRVTRRCRLWLALSRFNAQQVSERQGELSAVARDKLHNSNKRVGPTATACEIFTPKKKDYPLAKARDKCVSCGQEIDSPVAKTVRCPKCLTVYKPLATKILVLYDYEQVFKDRYSKLAGMPPPRQALALTEQELHQGKTDWRDTIVLYPNEKVKLADDGIHVEREGRQRTFEPYNRMYQVIDYGALTDRALSSLKGQGISVVQSRLQDGPERRASFPLYPSPGFVEKLRWLEQNSPLRKRLLESMMLSTIVATRRVANHGGKRLQVLVNRQLLEFTRMRGDTEMTLSRALAYEARVNGLYWSAYKTMLRVSGLEFQSRVRDRFVREIVQSIRARARGYSPANAAINYLHQRRLLLCRLANARAGIGWIGCEGMLHVAKREPSIGLLLDLSDSFRLADRESFLNATLSMELTRDNFVARLGRQRVWFYHPTQEAIGKLDLCGFVADQFRVDYRGKDMTLTGAYDEFVASFVEAVENSDSSRFNPFVYSNEEDAKWLASRGLERGQ